MTSRDDVQRVVDETVARTGRIDVWVNNAGRGITRLPSELTDADIDDMMLANVKSALYGIQAVLPHFKQRGRGHVVNVSSMLGRMPLATFRSAYCGAKHFLNALTANLRDELGPTHPGIQFSLVSPGVVRHRVRRQRDARRARFAAAAQRAERRGSGRGDRRGDRVAGPRRLHPARGASAPCSTTSTA